jgi:hypothetical protein
MQRALKACKAKIRKDQIASSHLASKMFKKGIGSLYEDLGHSKLFFFTITFFFTLSKRALGAFKRTRATVNTELN